MQRINKKGDIEFDVVLKLLIALVVLLLIIGIVYLLKVKSVDILGKIKDILRFGP